MIHETQNPKLKPAAQKLRKDMTREERHLWYDFLKTLPVNVNRQKVIGPYIVDFYIARAKIVIELDGSQHYEPEHRRMDLARDEYLAALGLQVLRYSNADVRGRFSAVCTDIWKHVFSDERPHPSFASQMPPSPKGKAKRDTIGYSVEKRLPFRGSWHGEAVTDEAVSRRGELEKGMIF